MNLSKEKIAIIVVVVILLIITLVVLFKPKNKQGYDFSVMGTRNFKMTPWESEKDNLSVPSPQTKENAELLQWWLNWKKGIPENIMEQIEALCPNIQSEDVMKFNGIPVRMINQLKLLKPTLEKIDKSKLRTQQDVQNAFNSCALTGVDQLGVVNSNKTNKGVFNYVV